MLKVKQEELTENHQQAPTVNAFWSVRKKEAARLEAETITLLSCQADPSSDPTSDRRSPIIHPMMMKEYGGPALDKLQRYTTAALNRMLRCRRELERIRRDEPGPGVADTDIANADIVII
jgi:hypothetical protein